MFLMMLIAILFISITSVLWIKFKSIVWWEWLAGSILSFVVVIASIILVKMGQTNDVETWSGVATHAIYTPRWRSSHEVAVYNTDKDGNRTLSHYETEYRWHGPHYHLQSSLGRFAIDSSEFDRLKFLWGGDTWAVSGSRPNYYSGDRNDYHTSNTTGHLEPVVAIKSFENRVKAAPNTFSFAKVPEGVDTYEWPKHTGTGDSGRLIGRARRIGFLKWDQMCSVVGPKYKVNLIMIGFSDSSTVQDAIYQEAAWVGGKKNDLVICFGGGSGGKAGWSYVFGWTDSELVKRNLETIVLNNTVDSTIVPKIKEEVAKNYKIKDWSHFDHISVPVPWWGYLLSVLILSVSQFGYYYWASNNEY
jgi:hypothetical protein